MSSRKELKPESIYLQGFEIHHDANISYEKEKRNTKVIVFLNVNGNVFRHEQTMWQFEVTAYLSSYGAEL